MDEIKANTPTIQNIQRDEDEINLLEYVYVLVKNKWIIIGMAILGFAIGHIAAIVKGPVYVADAVIAPKEAESVSTPNLSGLGMFGGMVASQLSMGGNASLEKIDLLLDGRTFNAKFVENNRISHILAPFLFPLIWDTLSDGWYHDSLEPKSISVGGYVSSVLLGREKLKNGTMRLSITHEDSLVTFKILSHYLVFLDTYIRENTQSDAKENKEYLEAQLHNVSDPLLRAKLQELIAKEIEEMMVVSKEAFKVVDDVIVGMSFREKKIYPLLGFVGGSFISVFIIILIYALISAEKTEESKRELDKITREFLRIPFVKN